MKSATLRSLGSFSSPCILFSFASYSAYLFASSLLSPIMSLNFLNSPPTPLRSSAPSCIPITGYLHSDALLVLTLLLLTTIFDILYFCLAPLLSSPFGSPFLG